MTHEEYIREAIKVAKESELQNAVAIGAIIVKDDEIISIGGSTVWADKDPSGHGESNSIRGACKKLDSLDLDGCVLYGTLEPCGMCLSTAAWANLNAIYFGAYREDVIGNNYEIDDWSAEQAAKHTHRINKENVEVVGGILREECKDLLKDYKDWQMQ